MSESDRRATERAEAIRNLRRVSCVGCLALPLIAGAFVLYALWPLLTFRPYQDPPEIKALKSDRDLLHDITDVRSVMVLGENVAICPEDRSDCVFILGVADIAEQIAPGSPIIIYGARAYLTEGVKVDGTQYKFLFEAAAIRVCRGSGGVRGRCDLIADRYHNLKWREIVEEKKQQLTIEAPAASKGNNSQY